MSLPTYDIKFNYKSIIKFLKYNKIQDTQTATHLSFNFYEPLEKSNRTKIKNCK